MLIRAKVLRQAVARKWGAFWRSSDGKSNDIETLKLPPSRQDYICWKRAFDLVLTPAFAIELHFIHLVIKQRSALKLYRVFHSDALYDFG